ncbi:MAG: DUF4261 domain-containing protein [Pirellulaceae bacterium]|jgi:hypothetical protein|nr:DUF4261 domain-containing protein [Pirellulaceae bacterium]
MPVSIAFVALADKPKISGAAITRDLAATWPSLPAASELEAKGGTLSFRVGPSLVVLGLMPAPIPWGDLEGPCATSWLWPKAAEELRPHRQHLIVTVMSDEPPLAQTKLLTQAVASIIATCPQTIGVYWGNATLVISPPVFREFAVEMLPDGVPLPMWVDFRVGPGPDGKMNGFTHGMQALGLMEIETQNSPESAGGLRERLMSLCGYLLENGPVIKDGDTVGESAQERIRVVYSPSAFGNKERVMRLDYSGASTGRKPWWKVW